MEEAKKCLTGNYGANFVLALIDVVMESDQAGLELIQYIRNVLRNDAIRLYIRTGQPGKAPYREVLNRLDIDGCT